MDDPLSTTVVTEFLVPDKQPGKTTIVVPLTEQDYDVKQLVQDIVEKKHDGFVFSTVDEDTSPHLIPEFFGKGWN